MDALKSQGKRTDLTFCQVGTKLNSAGEIASAGGDIERQVFRYMRLTDLIPEVLQIVDDGKIALTLAVELSYLTKDEQRSLLTTMEYDEITPSLSQAQRLRRLSEDQGLSDMR